MSAKMITIVFMNDEQIVIDDVKSYFSPTNSVSLSIISRDGKIYVFPLINIKYIEINK